MKHGIRIFPLLIALLFSVNIQAAALNSAADRIVGCGALSRELASVRIAIIDTGIDTARLDAARVLPGKNYVSDTAGDLVGHGTRIASLLLGADDGEQSIPGLAPNAILIPLTYYSRYPSGVPINGGVETIARAITDAVDLYAAQIIMISSGTYTPAAVLENAVSYAEEHGAVIISAVGNDGDDRPMYPAAYETVIGVGSVDAEGLRSDFSQTGDAVTLCAPGEALWTVSIKNSRFFEQVSGTSYACAYAAAAASVLFGMKPSLTPAELRTLLTLTATDCGDPGTDPEYGFGLLNLVPAIGLLSSDLYPAIMYTDMEPQTRESRIRALLQCNRKMLAQIADRDTGSSDTPFSEQFKADYGLLPLQLLPQITLARSP